MWSQSLLIEVFFPTLLKGGSEESVSQSLLIEVFFPTEDRMDPSST